MKARRPYSTITIVIVTVCSLILTAKAVCAESDYSAGGRPKIGLVLSGGGARGAAHIGVLRVLEEQRVPIDYITGTSAGAAVGGLYAMGLSTDEIEETLASVDWDDTFQDLPPRRFRSFRRKTDDYLFLVKKRPGFNNGKLRFPSGLIQGQKMDLILTAATLPAVGVSDFDSLPIPFRSVAAEVASGREVVLGSGNLGRAIRASMTVPIVFSPLVIDGQSLVDGGIVNNLPINVAQDMGADIIIAVDIGTPLADKEAISSAIDIGIQLSSFLARRGTDEQIGLLEPNDLLLVPELTDYSNSDFKIFREIIPYGRLAAEANLKTIQQWSLPEEAYQSYRDSVSRPKAPQPVINFVDVENDSRLADDVILSKLGGLDIGAPLNVQSLEQGIANVYGLELFQNIRYEVVQKDGVTGLKIDVEERSWGPNYIQFGTEYNSNSDGNSVFGISLGYLKTAMNSFSGEWRTTVTLGEEPEIETEWYQPLGAGSAAFIVPTLRFGQQLINIYDDGNLLTELRVREAHAELAAGRTIGNWGELRFGARFANGEYKVRVGDPSIPEFDSRLGEAFVRLSVDILDDVSFPTSGVAARGEWLDSRDELGADSNFNQIQFSGIAATSRNSNSLLVHARFGSTTNGIAPIRSLFQLGGYLDLSGFNEDELTGQNVARVGATVFHRFVNSSMLTAYLGLSAEVGNVWDRTEEITYRGSNWGGSVWLGAKTKLGPIIISYGTAESRRNAFYFILGHNLI